MKQVGPIVLFCSWDRIGKKQSFSEQKIVKVCSKRASLLLLKGYRSKLLNPNFCFINLAAFVMGCWANKLEFSSSGKVARRSFHLKAFYTLKTFSKISVMNVQKSGNNQTKYPVLPWVGIIIFSKLMEISRNKKVKLFCLACSKLMCLFLVSCLEYTNIEQ